MEYTAENIAKILALTKEGKREFLDNQVSEDIYADGKQEI